MNHIYKLWQPLPGYLSRYFVVYVMLYLKYDYYITFVSMSEIDMFLKMP